MSVGEQQPNSLAPVCGIDACAEQPRRCRFAGAALAEASSGRDPQGPARSGGRKPC